MPATMIATYEDKDFKLGTAKVEETKPTSQMTMLIVQAHDRHNRTIDVAYQTFYNHDKKEEKRARDKVAKLVKAFNS
jgi:hypothetical protein